MIVFYLLIGTVSVIGNSVVLFVVYKSKQLRYSQYVYNCSIAVSDIIWGFNLSYCFIFVCVKILGFEPTYHTDILFFLNETFIGSKLEISKHENNITNFKLQYDRVKLMTDSIFYNISLFNRNLCIFFLFISPVTLLVSFISYFFVQLIDMYR